MLIDHMPKGHRMPTRSSESGDGAISFDQFVGGNALSLENQSFLRDLIQVVRNPRKRVTLVLGAGVSIDAGLPSWNDLLMNIADQVTDTQQRLIAKKDPAGPMRKAEYLIEMVARSTGDKKSQIIKRGLYGNRSSSPTGSLADALARLAVVLNNRIDILTTNFDDVFETALQEYLLSDSDETEVTVTHLHGLIAAGSEAPILEPVVLAESMFLKHGKVVRATLTKALAKTTVLFVGVSLSDPNLVGALWDQRDGEGPLAYAFAVPELIGNPEDWNASIQYQIDGAEYLVRKLRVRPIFLKSYSQQLQALWELSLAAHEPALYVNRPKRGSSVRYGRRLGAALNDSYKHLGCSSKDGAPSGQAADDLRLSLNARLRTVGGPEDLLGSMRLKMQQHPLHRLSLDAIASDEGFGLFLWLRCRAPRSGSIAPYAINLMGSSTFSHQEAWSMPHDVEITSNSRYVAAQVLFSGRYTASNLGADRNRYPWKGVVAVPIVVDGFQCHAQMAGRNLDSLVIGAVTLNTTHEVTPDSPKPRSIISAIDDTSMRELVSAIHDAAITTLGL